MSRLKKETTAVPIDITTVKTVLTKVLPETLEDWALRGVVRVSALAADKFRTLTLTARVDGEHLFSTDWIVESDATDAGRVKQLSFAVPEAIRGTLTLHLLSSEATDTTVDVDARLNTNDAVLDRLPYALDACVIVEAGATDVERGTNLVTAYATACALTPGGEALSAINRACVLMPPGGMDVAAVTLVLNVNFVDFRGLGDRPEDVNVYSAIEAAATVRQTADDIRLMNFTIRNSSEEEERTSTKDFEINADNNANSRYEDMRFRHNWLAWGPYGTSDIRGTWLRCQADRFAWHIGPDKVLAATMFDCQAEDFSFGGDAQGAAITGWLERCTAGPSSFGGCSTFGIDISGTLVDCVAGDLSFALSKTFSGVAIRCRGGDYSFACSTGLVHPSVFSGLAIDCVGGRGSFGGCDHGYEENTGKCTGSLIRCVSRGNNRSICLEGATVEGCLLTTGVADQDGVTLLDSASHIHDSTVLVVEGGTGVPVNAAAAQSVSAAGNRYNNRSASETGLGENVTNTGAGEPAAILADTGALEGRLTAARAARLDADVSSRATPAQVKTQADGALVDYDPPTKAEMDAAAALLATPADVHTTVTPAYARQSSRRVGGIIHLPEDSNETLAWHLTDADGKDVDLTGYTGLDLEVYAASGDLCFERTLANGGLVIDSLEHGRVTITFTPDNLATAGTCKYEFWGTREGGLSTCLARGSLIVEPTFGPS